MQHVPDQPRGEQDGGGEIIAIRLQVVRKHRKRQAQQAARDSEQRPCAGLDRGPRIVGGAMDQHGHREEQPYEVVLPGQRRGHRHQAEQYAEFLGIRAFGPARCGRHDRDIAEPDQQRYRQHDPVRRLEIEIGDIHGSRRLGRIILIVVHRPRQPVRHGDDGLVDPGPVLLVALAEPLLRTRPHHALVPVLQLRGIVLEAAKRRRQHEQKHANENQHAGGSRPLPSPDQIGKHRHRKHLDGGGERKHASRHPSALVAAAARTRTASAPAAPNWAGRDRTCRTRR